jgi:hypothetical protein
MFTYSSLEDHQRELLDFCHEQKCDVLFTSDLVLIGLFLLNQKLPDDSSQKLHHTHIYEASSFKICKGNRLIKGDKYNFNYILKELEMNEDQFVLFTILLGNKFLPVEWLIDFYLKISCHNTFNLVLDKIVYLFQK